MSCKYCKGEFGQYERVLMYAAESGRWEDAKFAHEYDCLFVPVREEMAGAVTVHRLRDKLSPSKRA